MSVWPHPRIAYATGRPVLLCCDNMGDRGAAVRGSCATVIGGWSRRCSGMSSRTSPLLSGCILRRLALTWLTRHRACEGLPSLERSAGLSAGAPSLFRHILSSRHALAAAQFKLDIAVNSFENGWSCAAHIAPGDQTWAASF